MRVPGRRPWTVVGAVITSVLVLSGAIAGRADTPQRPEQTAFGPLLRVQGERTEVTLITGDRVVLGPVTDGRPEVDVIPAGRAGREVVAFQIESIDGDVHVLPSDVEPLVGSLLDRDLFNVTQLVAQGYDDAHRASLPLIVQRSEAVRSLSYDAAGLTPVRALPSLRATAVRAPRARAETLGAALVSPRSGPLAGVTHIWLDQRVEATALDPNLTQIGAPTAWDAGLEGDGVTVAVLDTGIDADHPDLAGKVVDQANFSSSPDVGDNVGHGTHVAATVAGTGAASDGARKGVAHGADLLNVKVLGDDGRGTESQIIAGMQWAAEHGARIASLSLSGATDGDDALSRAVDELTASDDLLFVIAAGNEGPREGTVGTPGIADSALTVGAVDANDALASFSSRGPRPGDLAMKPDIVAPGVDIIEARAAGTSLGDPVDDLYTKLSGTSMATPHVAGAAAILAEQHPNWSAARLKAVLEGAATVLPGLSVYEQGGGRLDLARAIEAQVVTDTNNLDFGVSGVGASQAASKTITLTNTGTAPATVDLAAALAGPDGSSVADGTVGVAPQQLVLGAGESGDVTVTVDLSRLPAGEYSGGLTVTPSSGSVLQLPIGLIRDPAKVELTVHLRDQGQPVAGGVRAFNVDDASASVDVVSVPSSGDVTLRVDAGHYALRGVLTRLDGQGGVETNSTVFHDELDVTEDTEITLDTSLASPVRAAVAKKQTAIDLLAANYVRTDRLGNWTQAITPAAIDNPIMLSPNRVRIGQIGHATIGTVRTYTQMRLIPASAPHGGASPVAYDTVFRAPSFPKPATFSLSAGEVARFARINQTFRALGDDDPGHYFESRAPMPPEGFARVLLSDELRVPLQRVDHVDPDPDVTWQQYVVRLTEANEVEFTDPPVTYRPNERRTATWFDAPLRQTALAARNGDAMLVEAGGDWLHLDSPSEQVGDLLDSADREQEQDLASTPQSLRLWRDGELLGEDTGGVAPIVLAPVESGPARYRIERTVGEIAQFPLSIRSRTVWEVTSTDSGSGETEILPLLQVRYTVPLDAANRAPARLPLVVGLRIRQTTGSTPQSVRTAKAWVSTDDGATWTTLPVHRVVDGRFVGVVPPMRLAPGADVSLRVRATDAAGATVEQTTIRAFAVRGRR